MPIARISEQAYETLKMLADKNRESKVKIIEKALEAYRRQIFLEEAKTAYAALKADPEKWLDEREERKAWDHTISDDLDDFEGD